MHSLVASLIGSNEKQLLAPMRLIPSIQKEAITIPGPWHQAASNVTLSINQTSQQNISNSSQPRIQVADEVFLKTELERPMPASEILHRSTQALKRLQVALFRYIGTRKFNLLTNPGRDDFIGDEEIFERHSQVLGMSLRKSRASIDLNTDNKKAKNPSRMRPNVQRNSVKLSKTDKRHGHDSNVVSGRVTQSQMNDYHDTALSNLAGSALDKRDSL